MLLRIECMALRGGFVFGTFAMLAGLPWWRGFRVVDRCCGPSLWPSPRLVVLKLSGFLSCYAVLVGLSVVVLREISLGVICRASWVFVLSFQVTTGL